MCATGERTIATDMRQSQFSDAGSASLRCWERPSISAACWKGGGSFVMKDATEAIVPCGKWPAALMPLTTGTFVTIA